MKKISIVIFLFLSFSALAQNSNELEEYVSKIKSSSFSDTIYLSDSLAGNKVDIIGFELSDTIVKAEITFPYLNRKRTVYYKKENNVLNDVCLLEEADIKTEEIYIEIKSWDNKIIESKLKNATIKNEKNDLERVLEQSDFTTQLKFKKIDDKAEKYFVKCRLVEKIGLPAFCGYFAYATAFKFEIIKTNYKTSEKFMVIIIQCPTERGEEFYQEGATYEAQIATNSGVTFGWLLQNNYEKENLPTFWARKIEKDNK